MSGMVQATLRPSPASLNSRIYVRHSPWFGGWHGRDDTRFSVAACGLRRLAAVRRRLWPDGTDQCGVCGTELCVTVEGLDTLKVVAREDGRMLTGTWTLPQDGNTLSDDYTEFKPTGLRHGELALTSELQPGASARINRS